MLPIHVINLPASTARHEEAQRQLNAQHVQFHFFQALNCSQGAELFQCIDEYAFVLHTGRKISRGEIGCFASHKALWQRCVDENRPLIIMEDDFRLSLQFSAAIQLTESLVTDLGIVRLQDERRGASVAVMQLGEIQLERYTKTPHCTMCYAISPIVARRLIEANKDFCAPVDVVMKHVWRFQNPMYCLTPYVVSDSNLSAESVIGDREKFRKPLLTSVRRFWLKTTWQMKRLLFNRRQSDDWIRSRFGPGDTEAA